MSNSAVVEAVLVAMILSDLMLLGSSRLRTCIRMVAFQGVATGLLPLVLHASENPTRAWLMAVGSIGIKGIVFPLLLLRILRDTGVHREIEPFVGYALSMSLGVGALIFSLWVGSRLDLPISAKSSTLMIPVGMATLLIGLLVIISRHKAVSQVLGYIVLENGIFLFGFTLVGGVPLLVELGVLMDAFVAVFLMGIAAYQISRTFDHIDVDRLDQMKG